MAELIKKASFSPKDEHKIPKGARIISKEVRMNVKEIENGYIIEKNYDIKYKLKNKDYTDYIYITKTWYSKDNPIIIKNSKDSPKMLADKL